MSSCRELDSWTQDFVLPAVVWLSGLFNPQSFLTGGSVNTTVIFECVYIGNINVMLFIS